jgi:SAM-dependent methyltransferase
VITCRVSKSGELHITKTANKTAEKPTLSHDNVKQYVLTEGMPVLPLVDLGVFTPDFHVIKAKYYKFKQINSFLKNIDSSLGEDLSGALNIVEFGCGKSYLTFILYYYFRYIKKIDVSVIGYDKNRSVVDFCNDVARKYQYDNLKFIEGDISQIALYQGKVDMIVTLHACDTATDHALYYAIRNKVKHIFCVPCCQQEVNAQIRSADEFALLLRYGLYKERFSALLTDCVRCETLNESGYAVDVVEFVGEENTPKNAMIRAHYTGHMKNYGEAMRKFLSGFGVEHTLLKLMDSDSEQLKVNSEKS